MSTAPVPSHPVSVTLAGVRDALAGVAATPMWSMPPTEVGDALVSVTRLAAQVAHLQLRLLAQAERAGVGREVGATSAANWLAHTTRTTRPALHRAARLALRLEDHPDLDTALAAGRITLDQAQAVVDALDALGEVPDLPDDTVTRATTLLLTEARDHDARALRILGRRVLHVIDPAAADAAEARLLAAEEADASAAASFTMSDDGHGQAHGRFTIPSLHAAILRKHLHAITGPAPGLTRHRLGQAFLAYLETRPEATIPDAGGMAATVVVTMTIESLMGGLAAAGLCDGTRISAGEARRLACSAGIIPLVLGGKSEPLDVGRRRRFHTKAQRLALATRDGGCTAEGCDAPPARCHAHHDRPWSRGGPTSLHTGRLLCPRHHTLAHDQRYDTHPAPHGKLRFTRRT